MRGASLCIFLPFMGLAELSFTKVGYQIAQNTRWWVRPLSNRMGCHSKRGDIHCLWSVSELSWDTWHRWDELLVESVYQLLVPLGSFLLTKVLGSQIAHEMPHFRYPLSTENTYIMRCWTAMRDINCLWSVSTFSLDKWKQMCLWVSPSYVPQRLTPKLPTKCKFGVSSHSQSGKLGAKLWGETSIAYELFQNTP